MKAIFHNLCTMLYWHLCGLTNKLLNTLSTEADVHGVQPETMASEWQTAFVVTKCHGVPCSLPSRITTKVLQDFKDQDQMFKNKTKTS